jgi:hypothetical protein
MFILSFDIGIKNLSYVLIEIIDNTKCIEECYNIIEWDIINIIDYKDKVKDKSFNEISNLLFDKILEKFSNEYLERINYIVIENQPVLKNPIMKSIQVMIYSFFMIKVKQENYNIYIKFQNANLKIKLKDKLKKDKEEFKDEKKKLNYKEMKQKGIYIVNHLFNENNNIDKEIIQKYNNSKKKDDLADCLLQGLYFYITI